VVTGIVALRTASQVVSWGLKAANRPIASLESPTIDLTTVILTRGEEPESFVVTATQATQMTAFLEDPAVVALQRIAFVRRLLPSADKKALAEFSDPDAFGAMARAWCRERDQQWSDLSDELWREIETDQATAAAHLEAAGARDDVADALAHRFFFGRLGVDRQPEYLRILDAIARDPKRQKRLRELLDECSRIHRATDNETFLVQGVEEERASFATLYIDRLLSNATTGLLHSAQEELDIASARPRVVIIGDPGVGKTTLTAWLRWRLAEDSAKHAAPIPVTLVARHVLIGPEASVLNALQAQLERDFQMPLTDEDVLDVVGTGWVALIVDGVDEILDPGQRRAIVEQLHAFAERFPFVPIVCTTRRTGFEVSLFKPNVFQILNLEEYTEDQVAEYADRWFARHGSALKVERFLGESRTLDDLRRNPLMLALLCTLFRQYDFIPRSRREVYLRCAALMFHEWDPRRGIQIPNLFKNEGEAILRDIALLFHQRAGTSQLIDERQLVRLISTYLKDRGTEPVGADAAARGLLEHCAGRAWILSKQATEGGAAQFAFTHRTFFEFFAAEAIIRRLNRENEIGSTRPGRHSLGSVASAIVDAYERDDTSVMPELLLQAADDLMGGMSTTVLTELRSQTAFGSLPSRSAFTALAIRLVAAAGVKVEVAADVFQSMFAVWSEPDPHPALASFTPLLDVASGHRTRLREMLRRDPVSGREFARRYARLALVGESGLFSDEWAETALEQISNQELSRPDADTALIYYGVDAGLIELDAAIRSMQNPRDLLFLEIGDYYVSGILWSSIGPVDDPTTRRQSWVVAERKLLEIAESLADDHRIQGCAMGVKIPVPEGVEFRRDLAILLAFFGGRDVDDVIAATTRVSHLSAFVEVVRGERDRLRDMPFFHERLTSAEKEAAKKERAIARERIHAAYREAWSARCPMWIKAYAGATEPGSHRVKAKVSAPFAASPSDAGTTTR